MHRAMETARAIGRALGLEIKVSALFHEITRPSCVRGKVKTDPAIADVKAFCDKHLPTIPCGTPTKRISSI